MEGFRILISQEVYNFAKRVCSKIKKEWYAFPLGRYSCQGGICEFVILDLFIPEQFASRAHVEIPADMVADALREILRRSSLGLVGMWHSHGEISVFHSSEDLANVERIFSTLMNYLPFSLVEGPPFTVALGAQFSIEPIIRDGFRGFSLEFGTAKFEVNFGLTIKDRDFFVRWYTQLALLKALLRILEGIGGNPTLRAYIRDKQYYIASVVINNRGAMDGRVFMFRITKTGIVRDSKKVELEIINEPAGAFIKKTSINEILRRIK